MARRKPSRRGRNPNRVALSATPVQTVDLAVDGTSDVTADGIPPDTEPDDLDASLAALAAAAEADTADDGEMPCSNCEHALDAHTGPDGACAVSECACTGFKTAGEAEAEAQITAAGQLVWDAEAGFMDLLDDLEDALNPGSDVYRVWVLDIALDLTSCVICVGGDDYYLVPFTLDQDNAPSVAASSDWTEVEQGWVTSDEGEAALGGMKRLAMVRQFQHGMPCACGHSLSEHVGAGGPCAHEDGRGTCSCSSFSEASAEAALRHLGAVRQADVSRILGLTAPVVIETTTTTNATGTTVFEVALPPEHQPGETVPEQNPTGEVAEPTDAPAAFEWVATLCPEAKETSDGRAFAPGSITWPRLEEEGALTLMGMIETTEGGHVGAKISGRIDTIWRDANLIRATGVFDSDEWGQNIARLVADGTLRGISVDLAIHGYEFGPRSDYFDADGNWAPKEGGRELSPSEKVAQETADGEEVILVITAAEIGMATVCPFQAFSGATIERAASLVAGANEMFWTATMQAGMVVTPARPSDAVETPVGQPEEQPVALVASGLAPVAPPAEWFADPAFDGPTGLTIDEDGRVYGHAALWHTCHIGIAGVCTEAPSSESGYAYFHLGEIECDDGSRVACGTVTLDAPHADKRLGRADATRHYDHTGTVSAHVVCGEDDHGIWVAGALDSRVTAEQLRVLRGSKLSGDWRNVNGHLELVALLAVNVPGFPVPRALVASVDGRPEVMTLLAAGLGSPAELTDEQRAEFAALREAVNGDAGEAAVLLAQFATLAAGL